MLLMNPQHDPSQQRLLELINELELIVSRDGAQVQMGIDEQDEDSFDFLLLGNRNGFLCLGIELLKTASMSGQDKEPQELTPDIDYLIAETSGFDKYRFVLDEKYKFIVDKKEEAQKAKLPIPGTFRYALDTLLINGILIFFVVTLIIGIATIVRWIIK